MQKIEQVNLPGTIEVFKHSMFGELPVLIKNGKEHFTAKVVAKMLGYSNPSDAILRHCKKDGVVFHEVIDSLGRKQSMKFISEGNLYRLITHSKLPSAERFESWVFDEVLPSIRKHGTYMTPDTIEKVLSDPDTIIKIATQLKEEQAKRMAAEAQVEKQKPKVLFASAVEASETSILIGQLAKIITQNGVKIGQNRLFEWLRDNGYLGKKGAHYNEPTQYSMERGWFEVTERTFNNPDGSIRVTRTTKVTGKGQVYFINKLLQGIAV
ncbi:phage antirepressor KilAC domain-containing protein [Rummeliibacillus sp. POC4]|uniref:phage antirepressor KilAC domain-containing protein n=1 Tax=Rummeliibacillus sp. POC4 TaxID=2305899 RepID=UPI000E66FA46|nr:phage antirepressor KilAC domain-containing protein [Rummeliibacillus sp. POC4]RIJ65502.1 phage repressor protein/antirepressor Ant [Rummeliibacillus sp. POC4]